MDFGMAAQNIHYEFLKIEQKHMLASNSRPDEQLCVTSPPRCPPGVLNPTDSKESWLLLPHWLQASPST